MTLKININWPMIYLNITTARRKARRLRSRSDTLNGPLYFCRVAIRIDDIQPTTEKNLRYSGRRQTAALNLIGAESFFSSPRMLVEASYMYNRMVLRRVPSSVSLDGLDEQYRFLATSNLARHRRRLRSGLLSF